MEQQPEVKQTNIGVVFLTADRVWKMKKSVRMEFLDFSKRADREQACHREVELNRRLAPDVYHGVADLHGPDGEPCEHFVVMDRLPDRVRLSTLIADRHTGAEEVRQVAQLLARFHQDADRSARISAAAGPAALRRRWEDLFAQLRNSAGQLLDDGRVDSAERMAIGYVDDRAELFTERVENNRVVDGHGDILAEDIFCLPDGPRILDCLEFDDQKRWIDQLDDVAFLAMDLEYRGRADLARELFDSYRRYAADTSPSSLAHHYVAYRALVRARVAAVRAEEIGRSGQQGEQIRQELLSHFDLSLKHLASTQPQILVVGGLPGTGKSTVTAHLSRRLGFVSLSSDRIRKELAGLPVDQASSEKERASLYRSAMTHRVYAELITRAQALLRRGHSVILDASWNDAAHRRRAHELALRTRTELIQLRCVTSQRIAKQRLQQRASQASDADENIAQAMAEKADRWPEAVALDTSGSERDIAIRAVQLIESTQ